MSSDRFITILKRRIDQFISYYSKDSNSLFYNDENRLIHPGEYGRYREDACKKLLNLIFNKTISLSDGFIITCNDDITTQCDIIGYNSLASPIVSDDIAKMFPAEEISLVGEVKSTLSKSDYIDALQKLANNKKIIINGRKNGSPRNLKQEHYNTIISILICNKLSFEYSDLSYEEIYSGIDRKYWHNAVLSIEDGLFLYSLDFNKVSEDTKQLLASNRYIFGIKPYVIYPLWYQNNEIILTQDIRVSIKQEDKYYHILTFLALISTACNDIWKYTYDPVEYLGLGLDLFFD